MTARLKEIAAITANLTLICFFAGVVLGGVYLGTHRAKEENQARREKELSLSLLGYGPGRPAPDDLRIAAVGRYLVRSGDRVFMGYTVPAEKDGEKGRLVLMSVEGRPLGTAPAPLAADAETIARSIGEMPGLGAGPFTATHVEDYLVVRRGGVLIGYLVGGGTSGFKAEIRMIAALNPDLSVRGVAILESEEDPGLGAETGEAYFLNQFTGKTVERVAEIEVTTRPLPEAFRRLLVSRPPGGFSAEEIEQIRKSYGGDPIYAVTGATISSTAVTRGVQRIVGRFAYRLELLEKALAAGGAGG